MKLKTAIPSLLLFAAASLVNAGESKVEVQGVNGSMWFTDQYTSAFYALDETNNQAVITFVPGAKGEGQPIRQVVQLDRGQSHRISVVGSGKNRLAVTLELARSEAGMAADVKTQLLDQSLALR